MHIAPRNEQIVFARGVQSIECSHTALSKKGHHLPENNVRQSSCDQVCDPPSDASCCLHGELHGTASSADLRNTALLMIGLFLSHCFQALLKTLISAFLHYCTFVHWCIKDADLHALTTSLQKGSGGGEGGEIPADILLSCSPDLH